MPQHRKRTSSPPRREDHRPHDLGASVEYSRKTKVHCRYRSEHTFALVYGLHLGRRAMLLLVVPPALCSGEDNEKLDACRYSLAVSSFESDLTANTVRKQDGWIAATVIVQS